jgi:hypothetical protein
MAQSLGGRNMTTEIIGTGIVILFITTIFGFGFLLGALIGFIVGSGRRDKHE